MNETVIDGRVWYAGQRVQTPEGEGTVCGWHTMARPFSHAAMRAPYLRGNLQVCVGVWTGWYPARILIAL